LDVDDQLSALKLGLDACQISSQLLEFDGAGIERLHLGAALDGL